MGGEKIPKSRWLKKNIFLEIRTKKKKRSIFLTKRWR
jgi:hypothetical protein